MPVIMWTVWDSRRRLRNAATACGESATFTQTKKTNGGVRVDLSIPAGEAVRVYCRNEDGGSRAFVMDNRDGEETKEWGSTIGGPTARVEHCEMQAVE